MTEVRIIVEAKGNGFGAMIVMRGVSIGSAESWPTRAEAIEAAAAKLLTMPERLRNLDLDVEELSASDDPAAARRNLAELIRARDASMAELSRLLGRNEAYLQQFIRRGSPERLDEDDRLRLAQYFNVDERLLGARDPWRPE
ncbi:hypothetical protein DFR49_2323 [Hephaestia caeni]|uniref:Uncharacterized protein n=1 Tax=Hephaestia caeni TaxID=645617 RepID=A0A397P3D1_9SPHN|nr:hypothetical protein DFR49_2323 [Hephaestia caeni]